MHTPSMPNLPPGISKNVLKEDFCVIHKGPLTEEVYTCKCGAKMCLSCALMRKKEKNRLCPKCSSIIYAKSNKNE